MIQLNEQQIWYLEYIQTHLRYNEEVRRLPVSDGTLEKAEDFINGILNDGGYSKEDKKILNSLSQLFIWITELEVSDEELNNNKLLADLLAEQIKDEIDREIIEYLKNQQDTLEAGNLIKLSDELFKS